MTKSIQTNLSLDTSPIIPPLLSHLPAPPSHREGAPQYGLVEPDEHVCGLSVAPLAVEVVQQLVQQARQPTARGARGVHRVVHQVLDTLLLHRLGVHTGRQSVSSKFTNVRPAMANKCL